MLEEACEESQKAETMMREELEEVKAKQMADAEIFDSKIEEIHKSTFLAQEQLAAREEMLKEANNTH